MTREYAFDDYGMVLDEETIKIIASKVFKDFSEEADTSWDYELYTKGLVEYISEFTGEAHKLTDEGTYVWDGEYISYGCEKIIYIPLSKYPTLFRPAYSNMNEIINELDSKIGKYLPQGFNYRSRLYHISGTYVG